jgi:hypothetical protein
MHLGTVLWYNLQIERKCKVPRQGVGLLQKRLEFESFNDLEFYLTFWNSLNTMEF